MHRVFRAAVAIGSAALAYGAPAPPARAVEPASPLAAINRQLPSWVRLSGELRAREEGFLGNRFTSGQDDLYLLQRVRLGISIRPAGWIEGFAQAQDARVSFHDRIAPAPPFQDSVDLRQAWIRVGRGSEKHNVSLRVGRQELAFGEERLVGAGNWGNVSRTFDAARLSARHGMYGVDVFAASVVAARDHAFDRHVAGDNLHGIYGSIDGWIPQARLEPFIFWRLSQHVSDTKTLGLRWTGHLPLHLDYTTELASQTGVRASSTVRAWAGFWRLARTFSSVRFKPGIRVEFNHSSGDRNPADSRVETFDVLYPTPHDKYGLADQVGWKNINHGAVIAELTPHRGLILQFKAHDSWLASRYDGLYNAGGALLVRDSKGQSGRHVGRELDAQILWTARTGLQAGAGLGHLFPGDFLKRTTPGQSYTFPWLGITYAF